GDLDGDGDADAMFGNIGNRPDTVWINEQRSGTLYLVQQTGVFDVIDRLRTENEQMRSDIEQLQDIVAVCCTRGDCPADLNRDGEIDGADLAMVLSAWGVPCDE
ncbi:MAG: hypothetical protein VXY94_11395, partial [Planctomycetota bacterium]|nr:hypothetical protein [Planctomycetota bacterium]